MCIRMGNGHDQMMSAFAEDDRSMERSVLYGVIAVLLVGIAVGGFAWYDHKRNTVLEVGVGGHGISVQKN
jgi:hypothetical protein